MRLSSSVVTVGKHNTVSVLAINLIDHDLSFTNNKQVSVFQFLSPGRGGICRYRARNSGTCQNGKGSSFTRNYSTYASAKNKSRKTTSTFFFRI